MKGSILIIFYVLALLSLLVGFNACIETELIEEPDESTTVISSTPSKTNPAEPKPDLSSTPFYVPETLDVSSINHQLMLDVGIQNCGESVKCYGPDHAVLINFYLSPVKNIEEFSITAEDSYLIGNNSVGVLNKPHNPMHIIGAPSSVENGTCPVTKMDLADSLLIDTYGFPNGTFYMYAHVDASNIFPNDTNLENNIVRSENPMTIIGSGDTPLYIMTHSPEEKTDTFLIVFKSSVLKISGKDGSANIPLTNPEENMNFLLMCQDHLASIVAPLSLNDDVPMDMERGYNTISRRFYPPGTYYMRCQNSPFFETKGLTHPNEAMPYSIRLSHDFDWYEMTSGTGVPNLNDNILDSMGLNAHELLVDGEGDDFEYQSAFATLSDVDWYWFEITE